MPTSRSAVAAPARRETRIHVYLRGYNLQKLRLASGLILFAFAAAHLVNHATGLISLELMHDVQEWRTAITRSMPGTVVLAAALLTHVGLALQKLFARRTLRMPWWEMLQITVALAIPFLLLPHIVNTRIASWGYGVADSYSYELFRLWPDRAVPQISLLLLVWSHGCIGLHYWLRLADGYKRVAPFLLVLALGIPALSIAGFATAGEQTAEIMSDPEALAALKTRSRWPNALASAELAQLRDTMGYVSAAVLAVLAAVHVGRWLMRISLARRSQATPTVAYLDGPTAPTAAGMTLLEISRVHGVAHAALCGGRARCGTCRVRILRGQATLSPPSAGEAATLSALKAGPNVRLACQIAPAASLSVEVLVRPEQLAHDEVEFAELAELIGMHADSVKSGKRQDSIAALTVDELDEPTTAARGRLSALMSSPAVHAGDTRLIGNRVVSLFDRLAPTLVFERAGSVVSLFLFGVDHSPAVAMRGAKNGVNVVGRNIDDVVVYAVSAVTPDDLDSFIDWIQDISASASAESEQRT